MDEDGCGSSQWEYLLRRYGSFSSLLGLSSSGIMWCGVLFLWWCGLLVFGPNWGFVECLHQTQPVKMVLSRFLISIYGDHSCWFGCYRPRMISKYLSQESSQCSLEYEVGNILDELSWMSAMWWDIWRFFVPSKIWSYIDPTIFAATVGLGDIIKKLFWSKSMVMVSSFSVIFDTEATSYSCSYNKIDFVELK